MILIILNSHEDDIKHTRTKLRNFLVKHENPGQICNKQKMMNIVSLSKLLIFYSNLSDIIKTFMQVTFSIFSFEWMLFRRALSANFLAPAIIFRVGILEPGLLMPTFFSKIVKQL